MRRDLLGLLAFTVAMAACSSQQTVIQPVPSENKSTVEFTCRLFRAAIAETEIELLCTSFEHHRQ